MQGFYDFFCLCFRCHDNHSSLACKIKWFQTEHTADTLYFRSDRNFFCIQTDPHIALSCDLIEYRSNSASCRVADHMQVMGCIHHFFYGMPQRCAVTGHISFDSKILSCKEDRASVASHISCYDNCISRLCQFSSDFYAVLDLSHSGCCDKYTVYLSLSCYLGISGYNTDTGFFCCFLHGCCNFFQFFHRESFFNDECTGQIKRFCSHACQIVDGTADGQLSDISSREKCRRYDKSIRRYCHFSCRWYKNCCIICSQIRIGKMCCKYFIDQL